MKTLSLLSYLFCAGSLFFGFRILFADRKNPVNASLFYLAAVSGFSTFCLTFFYSASSQYQAFIWHRFALIGILFFPVILLRFIVFLSPAGSLKKAWVGSVMYGGAIVFGALLLAFIPVSSRYLERGFWQIRITSNILSGCYIVYYALYLFAAVLLCGNWHKRAVSAKEKMKARSFRVLLNIYACCLTAAALALLISGIVNTVHFIFLMQTVFFFSLLLTVSRIRLISIFRVIDGGSIVNSMGDLILAVNLSGRIVEANKSASLLLGLEDYAPSKRRIEEVFCTKRGYSVRKIMENKESFTYNCEYKNYLGRQVPMSGVVIPIKDRSGVVTGKIIIGRDDSRAAEIHRSETEETERLNRSFEEVAAQNENLKRFMKMTEGRGLEYNRLKSEANELFKRFNNPKRYKVT